MCADDELHWQTESHLSKIEYAGSKTMSSRTEKARLEQHLRALTQEISQLKLALRT